MSAGRGRAHENLEAGQPATSTSARTQGSWELAPRGGGVGRGAAHRASFFFLVRGAGRSSPGPWANGQQSAGRTQPSG